MAKQKFWMSPWKRGSIGVIGKMYAISILNKFQSNDQLLSSHWLESLVRLVSRDYYIYGFGHVTQI